MSENEYSSKLRIVHCYYMFSMIANIIYGIQTKVN